MQGKKKINFFQVKIEKLFVIYGDFIFSDFQGAVCRQRVVSGTCFSCLIRAFIRSIITSLDNKPQDSIVQADKVIIMFFHRGSTSHIFKRGLR